MDEGSDLKRQLREARACTSACMLERRRAARQRHTPIHTTYVTYEDRT